MRPALRQPARVSRGAARPRPLPLGPPADLRRPVASGETVADVLAATYTDAFLVLRGGAIRAEVNPDPQTARPLFSVGKSLVGCIAGILVADGLLELDAPVARYVPELPGYAGATVRHLLDMRSGIAFSEDYLDPASEIRALQRLALDDGPPLYEFLTTLQAGRQHGGPFEYRSCETDVLGWVCERASGTPMPVLIGERIWSRIGAEQELLATVDVAGTMIHDGGLSATLRDLGRFGLMLAAGGHDVLPHWWLADTLAGGPDSRDAFAASPSDTRMPGGMYRNQFWVPARDALVALGIHGQLLYVEPARDIVVAKLSSWPAAQDARMLADTIAAIDTLIAGS